MFQINALFFSTTTTAFFIFSTKEMLPANSSKKCNFLPDTPWATLPSFFRVFSLIIIILDSIQLQFYFCIVNQDKNKLSLWRCFVQQLANFFFLLVDFTQCIYFVDIFFISSPFFWMCNKYSYVLFFHIVSIFCF